jgi:hypothetical protein
MRAARKGAAVMLVVALAMGMLLTGSTPGGAAGGSEVTPQSGGCAVTFTNPGPPALTACVSGHGNVNDIIYSPFGGAPDQVNNESYCLRDLGSNTVYYDAGVYGEAGWGVATQSSTSNTVTTTRTTTDGVFTLTQNLFFKYGSRMVLVGNLLKNNDTVGHTVRFDRALDADINATGTSDVFDTAGASVFAQETDGMASTFLANPSLIGGIGVSTFANWFGSGTGSHTTCLHTFAATPTAPGDYVGINQGVFGIAPGATVNYRIGYRLL